MDCKKSERDDGMNRWVLLFTSVFVLAVLLASCGSKSEDEVVGDLSESLQTLDSYKAEVDLVLQTGQDGETHEYALEVWYKKPEYYRVSFTNKERDVTQIILKNDDGVYVLTPHLNKSFRFQSGWPEQQSQVYLYESLVKDILADANRTFQNEGDTYIFEAEANYQNSMLTQQKIWLTHDLAPAKVQVMDADYKVMVEVNFTHIEFDHVFEDDAFDIESNMQGATSDSQPTQVDEQEESEPQEGAEPKEHGMSGALQPAYTPINVQMVEEKEMTKGDEAMTVMRYEGDYNYTLIQQRPQTKMVYMPEGKPVDLGYTIAVQSGNHLTWSYEGLEFVLAGNDLPLTEMVKIAQSVVGQVAK